MHVVDAVTTVVTIFDSFDQDDEVLSFSESNRLRDQVAAAINALHKDVRQDRFCLAVSSGVCVGRLDAEDEFYGSRSGDTQTMKKQVLSSVQLTGEKVGSSRRCRTTIGRSSWSKGDRPAELNFVRSVAARFLAAL